MKIFKLIKSLDYVVYPSYRELIKISDAVSNSITTFRGVLISAVVGVLFDVTPLSECILTLIKGKKPSGIIGQIINYENISLFVSIIVAIVIYGIFIFVHFLSTRWGSNKDTKSKRDIIVYEFYNVAIPQLIEVKSMLEQMKDDDSGEERKKILLLLQAKHETCSLYGLLSEMRVIERKKTGVKTANSNTLQDRISECAYRTFLEEMLKILLLIFDELSNFSEVGVQEDIGDIRANINKTGVFDQVSGLKTSLNQAREHVNA